MSNLNLDFVEPPFISIIILNWNGASCIKFCLDSVSDVEYPKNKFEIIVVDNASTDDSIRIIKRYSNVKLIQNKKNLGFCEGNNVGIRAARGEIIVLLNNDCYVPRNWLKELINVFIDNKNVGIVGSIILFPDGRLQAAGFFIDAYGRSLIIGLGEQDLQKYNYVRDVDCVSGASVAIRKEVLQKIGLFDPFLFAYYDMPDLCERAKKAGYRVVVAPSSIVYHFTSHGWRKKPLLQNFLVCRNRLYFLLKHRRRGLIRSMMLGDILNLVDMIRETLTKRALFYKTKRIGPERTPLTIWRFITNGMNVVSGILLAWLWFLTIGNYTINKNLKSICQKELCEHNSYTIELQTRREGYGG